MTKQDYVRVIADLAAAVQAAGDHAEHRYMARVFACRFADTERRQNAAFKAARFYDALNRALGDYVGK